MQTRKPDVRTVPPVESRQQWNALVESIATEGNAIVEGSSGEKVAVISYEEFLAYQQERQKRLLEGAIARLEEMEERQSRRNADLSEEQVEELAERFSREVIDNLAAEGKLVFERDQK